MARPVTNKIRKYVVKVKQKNGDTYVLERQSRYDSDKGYAVTISDEYSGPECTCIPMLQYMSSDLSCTLDSDEVGR